MFSGRDITFAFGGHPLECWKPRMLCLSGGVPLTLPLVVEALKREIPVTNDSQIFMEAVKANVIGITGSAGKTTTTTLTGAIAKAALEPGVKVWVGGNIGTPMIDFLDEIKPEDWVVLELSSFQLGPNDHFTPCGHDIEYHAQSSRPSQNHAGILRSESPHPGFQADQDIAILNRDDRGSLDLKDRVKGQLVTFGFSDPEPSARECLLKTILFISGMIKTSQKLRQ